MASSRTVGCGLGDHRIKSGHVCVCVCVRVHLISRHSLIALESLVSVCFPRKEKIYDSD